jgi:lysophospholipase L1-like esterase
MAGHPRTITRRGQRLRRLRRRLALIPGGILLGLLLGELLLRVVGFSYPLYPEKIEFGAPSPQQMASGFLPDRDLFWVPKYYFTELLPAVRAAQPQLVFMGGSVTHWGTYPRLLADMVRRRLPGRMLVSANFGVAGYSTHQGLRQLARDVLPLRPQVVTLFYGWNDHWIGFGVSDAQVTRLQESPLLFQLQRRSRLYQLVVKGLTAARIRQQERRPLRVSPPAFADNLTEMIRLCRKQGVVPVLLTAPTSHRRGHEPAYLAERHIEDLNDLVPLHQRYVEIVREVAARERVPLCDLALRFQELLAQEPADQYFQADGIHLLPQGDAKVAEYLYDCLQSEGLLARVTR